MAFDLCVLDWDFDSIVILQRNPYTDYFVRRGKTPKATENLLSNVQRQKNCCEGFCYQGTDQKLQENDDFERTTDRADARSTYTPFLV